MLGWLSHLDRLFRGDITRPEELRDGRIGIDAGGMTIVIVFLGMIYGLCMGSYSLLKEVPDASRSAIPICVTSNCWRRRSKCPHCFI